MKWLRNSERMVFEMPMPEIKLPDEMYIVTTTPDGRTIHTCTMRQKLMHCIGMDDKGTYKRHGRVFYKPYRNYFKTTNRESDWEQLARAGYVDVYYTPSGGVCYGVCYRLTRRGLDWLGEQLGVVIKDVWEG